MIIFYGSIKSFVWNHVSTEHTPFSVGLHSDNDGNADIAKEVPPNSLQHLNFGENMESQNENKIEADHIDLQKSRAVDLQKLKQSKLVNAIYVHIIGELFCFHLF